jgi:hypothetical protein
VFDRHVAPSDSPTKVELIRQFFKHHGRDLPSSIDQSHPEYYAQDYEKLIRGYVEGLKGISSLWRSI